MFRERLSRSAYGGHIHGVSISQMIQTRLLHPFGLCAVVIGAQELGDGSFLPFAKCWVCGKESPNDLPTYATLREHLERRDNG